jgi:hypothetical protein
VGGLGDGGICWGRGNLDLWDGERTETGRGGGLGEDAVGQVQGGELGHGGCAIGLVGLGEM